MDGGKNAVPAAWAFESLSSGVSQAVAFARVDEIKQLFEGQKNSFPCWTSKSGSPNVFLNRTPPTPLWLLLFKVGLAVIVRIIGV